MFATLLAKYVSSWNKTFLNLPAGVILLYIRKAFHETIKTFVIASRLLFCVYAPIPITS